MDNNQLNKAYAEQYAKDHNLIEKYKDCIKQKPLSDDEILNAIKKSDFPLAELSESAVRGMTNFARAIEERHGIK